MLKVLYYNIGCFLIKGIKSLPLHFKITILIRNIAFSNIIVYSNNGVTRKIGIRLGLRGSDLNNYFLCTPFF